MYSKKGASQGRGETGAGTKGRKFVLSVFSHSISNKFFLVLLCVESTMERTRKEKKVLSFEIFTSVWGAESSTHGKKIQDCI